MRRRSFGPAALMLAAMFMAAPAGGAQQRVDLTGTRWNGVIHDKVAGAGVLDLSFPQSGRARFTASFAKPGATNTGTIDDVQNLGLNTASLHCWVSATTHGQNCIDEPGTAASETRFTFILNSDIADACSYNVNAWSRDGATLRGQYYCATKPSANSGTFDLHRQP